MTAHPHLEHAAPDAVDDGQRADELTRLDLDELERADSERQADEGGMSATELYEYDRDAEFALDAADDEARADH